MYSLHFLRLWTFKKKNIQIFYTSRQSQHLWKILCIDLVTKKQNSKFWNFSLYYIEHATFNACLFEGYICYYWKSIELFHVKNVGPFINIGHDSFLYETRTTIVKEINRNFYNNDSPLLWYSYHKLNLYYKVLYLCYN